MPTALLIMGRKNVFSTRTAPGNRALEMEVVLPSARPLLKMTDAMGISAVATRIVDLTIATPTESVWKKTTLTRQSWLFALQVH